MGHYLIVGRTESGKSNYAKCMIETARRGGVKSLLLDPIADRSFNADFATTNPEEFLATVFHPETRSCLVIVDEAAQCVGRYNPAMERIAFQSRHWGHQSVFVTQNAIQISPNIRNNCSTLVCFPTGPQAANVLCEQYGAPEIKRMGGREVERGEYLYIPSIGEIKRGNVFEDMKKLGLFRP